MAMEANIVRLTRGATSRWISRLRVHHWVGPLLGLGSVACLIVFAVFVYDAVRDQEKPIPALLVLPITGFIAIAAALVVGWKPLEETLKERLLSKEGGATITLAILQAIGAIASMLGLFEPRSATSADTDRINENVTLVEAKVDALQTTLDRRFSGDAPILSEIEGRWGEEDPLCGLVWEISVVRSNENAALVAERVVRPKGVPPYRLVSEITRAEGNHLWVYGLEPASAKGFVAEIEVNPATQRLTWDDKGSAARFEEYVRCPDTD